MVLMIHKYPNSAVHGGHFSVALYVDSPSVIVRCYDEDPVTITTAFTSGKGTAGGRPFIRNAEESLSEFADRAYNETARDLAGETEPPTQVVIYNTQ
jgi:hypothetical protein